MAVKGLCPQGHRYNIDYELKPGARRTYCQSCDERDWPRGVDNVYPRRPCWGCGKPILAIFYYDQDTAVFCDISCFTSVRALPAADVAVRRAAAARAAGLCERCGTPIRGAYSVFRSATAPETLLLVCRVGTDKGCHAQLLNEGEWQQ